MNLSPDPPVMSTRGISLCSGVTDITRVGWSHSCEFPASQLLPPGRLSKNTIKKSELCACFVATVTLCATEHNNQSLSPPRCSSAGSEDAPLPVRRQLTPILSQRLRRRIWRSGHLEICWITLLCSQVQDWYSMQSKHRASSLENAQRSPRVELPNTCLRREEKGG